MVVKGIINLHKMYEHVVRTTSLKLKKVSNLPLPLSIDIEPTNYCNLNCPHCQRTYWSKKNVNLDVNSFQRILDQFPHLSAVKLQGVGEPLLNNQLISMLKLGEKRGISMSFFSNGTVCNEKIAEQLLQLKDTQIIFSIDAATAEVFEKIRVGGDFEKILSNIKNLIQLRGNKNQPQVSIWTVITKENIHEIPDIVRLAKELRVDWITLQTFLSDWGKEDVKGHTDPIRVSVKSDRFIIVLKESQRIARENQVDLRIYYGNFLSKKEKCYWPWTSAFIACNGDVVPCCVLSDSDTIKMGNVFEKDFSEIWKSKKYQDFRDRIRTHNLPDFCKNCYVD